MTATVYLRQKSKASNQPLRSLPGSRSAWTKVTEEGQVSNLGCACACACADTALSRQLWERPPKAVSCCKRFSHGFYPDGNRAAVSCSRLSAHTHAHMPLGSRATLRPVRWTCSSVQEPVGLFMTTLPRGQAHTHACLLHGLPERLMGHGACTQQPL